MKRRKRRNKTSIRVLKVWTQADAVAAIPYLKSVAKSVREHWLASRTHKLRAEKLAQVARPNRDHLIHSTEANREASRASTAFQEALQEFTELDILCVDPASGVALIPCRVADDLAWLRFELFAPEGLVGWRLHHDPLDENRPLDELAEAQSAVGEAGRPE